MCIEAHFPVLSAHMKVWTPQFAVCPVMKGIWTLLASTSRSCQLFCQRFLTALKLSGCLSWSCESGVTFALQPASFWFQPHSGTMWDTCQVISVFSFALSANSVAETDQTGLGINHGGGKARGRDRDDGSAICSARQGAERRGVCDDGIWQEAKVGTSHGGGRATDNPSSQDEVGGLQFWGTNHLFTCVHFTHSTSVMARSLDPVTVITVVSNCPCSCVNSIENKY